MTNHCGRLQLERFVSGELDEQQVAILQQHLKKCSRCSEVVADLESERSVFLQKYPFASFSRVHAPVIPLPWYKRMGHAVVLRPAFLPVFGAFIVALMVVPYLFNTHIPGDPKVLFKGKNSITYIYQRDGVTFQRSPTDNFKTGDRLQILYTSLQKQQISLLSIDMRGTVSFYHPDNQASVCSIPIVPGPTQTYPVSIELDDTPGMELIIGLFSEKPLSVTAVSSWVKKYAGDNNDLEQVLHALIQTSHEVGAVISALLLKKE